LHDASTKHKPSASRKLMMDIERFMVFRFGLGFGRCMLAMR
jgi:hypothetical protein